jgi:hypothetical protein
MGGPSGNSGGSADAPNTKRSKVSVKSKAKNAAKKVGNFIATGGVTGAIVRGVSGAIEKSKAKAKDRKINDSYLGSPDYQGDVSKKPRSVDPRTGRDNDNNNQPTQKSIEQPKVASQMDNSEVKSDLIMADKTAPTDVEMTDDELLLKRKRGRKTKTVLTSVVGDTSKATLSKKTLLG